MSRKLCFFMTSLLAAVSVSVLATAAADAVDIAIYWGQNASEGTLRDTCGTGLYAYINLAFLSTFGAGRAPVLDLDGHCDAPSGTCASLAADIAFCQSAGVKVLLSMGGDSPGYNLSSPTDAQDVATYLWDNFLGGNGAASSRPLGDSVLDGVDLDIEAPSSYYDDLARNLTSLYRGAAVGGRAYMLTAAPQCPFPNASLAAALGTGLFDHVWVQFYNNPQCEYAAQNASTLQSAWQQWTAALPSASVFLGLPASLDAAGSGFVDADTLVSRVLPLVEGAPNYGGIMLWSRSYDKDSGFSVKLQSILQNRGKNRARNGATSNYARTIYFIVGVVAGILLLVTTCFLCHKKYRYSPSHEKGSATPPKTQPFQSEHTERHLKRYSYSEVERMTKTFAHKLGQGSHGDVYRGNDLLDALPITVKVLKDYCRGGGDKDFVKAVASIGRICHANVAPLLGFCLQGPTRALVYDYMPNGSLQSYGLGNGGSVEGSYSLGLKWEKLFDIAIGVARGVEYLHGWISGRASGVHISISIKPQNILLDHELCPKISDVGVANLCLHKEGARGRDGYDAPEVVSSKSGAVSSNKSDVYRYGVMVLEMVRAKGHVSAGDDTTSEGFAQWLCDCEHLDQFCNSIADISGDTRDLVRKMTIVALWCMQTGPMDRPSMSRVVEMLESSIADLELPRTVS